MTTQAVEPKKQPYIGAHRPRYEQAGIPVVKSLEQTAVNSVSDGVHDNPNPEHTVTPLPTPVDVPKLALYVNKLMQDVNPAEGLRRHAGTLLGQLFDNPRNTQTYGELSGLITALDRTANAEQARLQSGPMPLTAHDRAAAQVSLERAKQNGDEAAVEVLQGALAVGQAVMPVIEDVPHAAVIHPAEAALSTPGQAVHSTVR